MCDFTYRTRGKSDLHSPKSIKRGFRLVAFNTSAVWSYTGRISAGVDSWLVSSAFTSFYRLQF